MSSMQTLNDRPALMAREYTVLSLAAALSNPHGRLARTFTVESLEGFRAAWAYFTALAEAETGTGIVQENDIEGLMRWLALPRERRESAHRQVFGLLVSRSCPPYEMEYISSSHGIHRAHALAEISGFYRAFGLVPDSECPERQDHVSLELEFTAFLFAKQRLAEDDESRIELCAGALRKFFARHPLWWMPAFAKCLQARVKPMTPGIDPALTDIGCYSSIARLLQGWLQGEMALLGVPAPTRPIAIPNPEILEVEEDACNSCGATEEFSCARGEGR